MKGNQGLEALAALCGGQHKAIDKEGGAPSASTGTNGATSPSTPPRSNPETPAASPSVVKSTSPVAAAVTGVTNQLLIRQAAERNASEAATQPQPAQHHPAVAAAVSQISSAPGIAPGALTPQQISAIMAAAANPQGGRLDPALAQSLIYPAALRGAAAGVEAAASGTPIPGVTNIANTMQQLLVQQYLAQANAQQQQQQQQQAQVAAAAAAAAAAATNGHPQAALLAMTLAAGKAGQSQPQHFLSNGAPAPIASTTSTSTSTGKFFRC